MAQSTTHTLDVYQPRNLKASAYYKCVGDHFVPHWHWVFSIPKRLRIYFLYDRKLLAKLSVCAWNVIKGYLQSAAPGSNAVPGASISVQTYGDFSVGKLHADCGVTAGDDGGCTTIINGDLSLDVNCAIFGDAKYSFTLNPFQNPDNPFAYYRELDLSTFHAK